MAQGISMMGGSGAGGGGSGMAWLQYAQAIGDINQTAYNQNAETSFSAVADPAGWTLQTGKAIGRSVLASKQRKLDRKQQNAQIDLLGSQKRGLDLANKEEERKQQWNSDLRRLLYGGRK